MEQKKTKIYLSYLGTKEEKQNMTNALDFLRTGDKTRRDEFLKIAESLYGEGIKLDFAVDNGNHPHEWRAVNRPKDLHFYIVMQFERKDMSEQAIDALGENDRDDFDWRYFYGIAICEENLKMYAISYSNRCSPNWNLEYLAQQFIVIDEVDFPIIRDGGLIYKMDDALHGAINAKLIEGKPLFGVTDDSAMMVVKDQHGSYTKIVGKTIDDIFLDYANNYTGYRNYRRQMASEWEIVSESTRERYESWKKTAKGLKSDFDKFYGDGIVD